MSNLYRFYIRCLLVGFLASFAPYRAGAGIIANGGFEAGGGSFAGWTAVTALGSGGAWNIQTGTSAPINAAFPVAGPPEGLYAAMTDGVGPGSQALLQSFTVPVGAGSVILSFDYFLLIPSSRDFVVFDTLDYNTAGNQQARVDILSQSAGAFDLDASVVQNVFQTNPGDPNQYTGYQTFSMDITSSVVPGATYQLRFAEVDTLGTLLFGVDNVSIDTPSSATPEPGTALLGLTGIAAAAWLRRKARAKSVN